MEGHLRGIIGQLTVEEIVKQPEMVSDRMRSTCADDMNKMGLEVISFTIKEVRDKNEYITNMGRPDVARIKRDADVAAAEADRDTAIKRALATRESAVAKAQADQERVLAETLSLAKQAEAQRDLEVKKAQFLEVTKRQQAQADKAYDIQTNIMQQQVIAEQVKVQQIEKEQQVKVQEAEINRREKELIATVLKGAEIERQRIETLAAAEKQRLIAEAEGQASSIRAQGEAEAEIIFKKGEAEAKAMNVKAEAFQEYNQAAVIDRLFASMPEVVKALAAPLANVDKITIVSTGNGDASGMNKITGDITKMAAQVPALFETLSGMPLAELLGKVRQIGDKGAEADRAAESVARGCGDGPGLVPASPSEGGRIAPVRRAKRVKFGAGYDEQIEVHGIGHGAWERRWARCSECMAGHVGVWLAIGVAIGMVLGASVRTKNRSVPSARDRIECMKRNCRTRSA